MNHGNKFFCLFLYFYVAIVVNCSSNIKYLIVIAVHQKNGNKTVVLDWRLSKIWVTTITPSIDKIIAAKKMLQKV